MGALRRIKKQEPKLIRYDAMCQAIDRCKDVDEAKEIRDKAIALAAYARQAHDLENERKCREIRIRAERHAGKLLQEAARNGTRAKAGSKGPSVGRGKRPTVERPTLADYGISKDQSSNWQKLAEVSDERFETELKKSSMPSSEQILKDVFPQPEEPSPIANVDPKALYTLTLIVSFDREGLLECDPLELRKTMTPTMHTDIMRLTPLVIAWLDKLLTGGSDGTTTAKKTGT